MATLNRNPQHPIKGHVYVLKGYIGQFVYNGTYFLSLREKMGVFLAPLVYDHIGSIDDDNLRHLHGLYDNIYNNHRSVLDITKWPKEL